jgi:hypothetical protein
MDMQKQWEETVANMMRLSATFTDSKGQKKAMIAYQGKNHMVSIGDVIGGRKITDISSGKLSFTQNGYQGTLGVEKIPEKPAELDEDKKEKQYNW